jgi:hypothetical protein
MMLGRSSTHRSIVGRTIPSLAAMTLLAALVPAGPSQAAVQVVTKATVSYTPPDTNSADITLAGGIFGTQQSVNNCVSNNTLTTSSPANIQVDWACKLAATPNPGGAALAFILQKQAESQARTSVAQPVPGPQPTMPNPCKGVPKNPLCA